MLKYVIVFLLTLAVFPFTAMATEFSTFDVNTLSQDRTENLSTQETLAPNQMRAFDPAVFTAPTPENKWINEFDVVIVINKSDKGSTAQSLRLYKKGQLTLTTKVSTGREHFEKQKKWFWSHGPKNSYFSSTDIGYYTPEYLDRLHKSQLWGSIMPWAVFFNEGVAIHQAPKGTEDMLGSRASGGCVRTSPEAAPVIYQTVEQAGKGDIPMFSRTGDVVFNMADGQPTRRVGYRTLVIVEDVVTP